MISSNSKALSSEIFQGGSSDKNVLQTASEVPASLGRTSEWITLQTAEKVCAGDAEILAHCPTSWLCHMRSYPHPEP